MTPEVDALWTKGTILIASSTENIFMSTDIGNSWVKPSSNLLPFVQVTSMAATGSRLFLGNTETLWTPIDGGFTWNTVIYQNSSILTLCLGALYRFDGFYFNISTDSGASWKSVGELLVLRL